MAGDAFYVIFEVQWFSSVECYEKDLWICHLGLENLLKCYVSHTSFILCFVFSGNNSGNNECTLLVWNIFQAAHICARAWLEHEVWQAAHLKAMFACPKEVGLLQSYDDWVWIFFHLYGLTWMVWTHGPCKGGQGSSTGDSCVCWPRQPIAQAPFELSSLQLLQL